MNRQRRKDLDKVREYLGAANQPLADALNDLEGIRDEEQEAFDGMPEGLAQSETGERIQEALEAPPRGSLLHRGDG
jgi:hypothetical protein